MNLLYAVRHGESTTNVSGVVPEDDASVALTELGERQATAVGRWLASLGPDDAPEVVWCSPYLRAVETWRLAALELPDPPRCHVDVRLRDRDSRAESFGDVAERLGEFLGELSAGRVLIVAHDAVVLMFRQIIEGLGDAEVRAIARSGLAGNASVTTWRDGALISYDERSHLAGP